MKKTKKYISIILPLVVLSFALISGPRLVLALGSSETSGVLIR
jgi:hypothetical protein